MSIPLRVVLFALVLVSCVGCDLATKTTAHRALRGRPPVLLLGGAIQLCYAENPGGFLSAGADLPRPVRSLLFVTFSLAIVITVSVVALAGSSVSGFKVIGCALIAARGLGNLVDRVTRGFARDWIVVRTGPLHTGVFNLADVAIMAGIALLLLAVSRGARRDPAA